MGDAWDRMEEAAAASGVRIAPLDALRDTAAVNAVISRIWGGQELGHELLQALQHAGCVFLGARDSQSPGEEGPLVGYVMGFVGTEGGLHVHSHMLAVVPEWQSRGVGLTLKLAQRAWALDVGIPDVRWTFDPMLRANARFNLTKLGAVATRFLPNFYGSMTDDLNRGERSDRFEVSWITSSERVAAALRPGPPRAVPPPADAPLILLAGGDADAPQPVATGLEPGRRALVEIPRDHLALRRRDPALAAAWRDAAATAFASCFDRGLVATALTADGRYLFEGEI
jgi:predicted GNAT superfamily acetyltransferase